MRFCLDAKTNQKGQDLQSFPNRLSKSLSSFAGSPNKFGAKQTP
jgi:Fe-S cluster biosynthesis and repair protein YggX